MNKMTHIRSHEILIIVLLLIVGSIGMWLHAHALIVADPHDDSLYALYHFKMLCVALVAGLVAPRISLLSAFSLFVLQPVVASRIFPPDPLFPIGMVFLFLFCLLGAWLGQLFRRFLTSGKKHRASEIVKK